MTEPTAKPTVTLNDTKGTTTSVIHKDSINQKDVKVKAQNNQRAVKNKQKGQITAALDKAALLALFTLPNAESNSELSAEQSHLNTTNQIPVNHKPKTPAHLPKQDSRAPKHKTPPKRGLSIRAEADYGRV